MSLKRYKASEVTQDDDGDMYSVEEVEALCTSVYKQVAEADLQLDNILALNEYVKLQGFDTFPSPLDNIFNYIRVLEVHPELIVKGNKSEIKH
jgi:sialic acid synthase SpsE|tara:strand:- start:4096 stop:4374 length:279 start_codon:yes stop_codon:yes gene_type:complete